MRQGEFIMSDIYGDLNASHIGATMREGVERAIRLIRNKRFTFELTQKGTKKDGRPDWVTDADIEAQEMYTRLLRGRFPLFGILGEEAGLHVACTHPTENFWFSVDPLDGTSAYKRIQSHGIATMIALMHNHKVIAVAMGDVMTGEIYYYRPESEKTHRLDVHQHEYKQLLSIDPERVLEDQFVLLRDPVEWHSETTRRLVNMLSQKLFCSYEITGGSIGLSMARLWKGEVGAAILRPGTQNPWDICPVIGMTERLGFVFFSIPNKILLDGGTKLSLTRLLPSAFPFTFQNDMLIIHESRIQELETWCQCVGFTLEL